MKIGVVGTGYVGLVTGTCIANTGLDVRCIDVDEQKIASLKEGRVPFYEPSLEELMRRNMESGRLHFTSSLDEGVAGADAVFLAVGTPMGEDGAADLTYLLAAAEQVTAAATGDLVMITKSTVPVGTGERLKKLIEGKSPHSITVASNPEFLKEGDAVNDFLKPDRIIIGADDAAAHELLDKIYRPFMLREYRVIHMDIKSAELTKYAANGMLATRISFMNDMANLCEKVGANIDLVRTGISSDKRIGRAFLYAGVGYGGSCFPKDVKALIHTGKEAGHDLDIMAAVDAVNIRQRGVMLTKVLQHFGGDLSGKTLAVWGLAFKPRTDDIRESPAVQFIEGALSAGAAVRAYDRAARKNVAAHFSGRDRGLSLYEDEYEALDDADGLVLMTEWPEFRQPSWSDIKKRLRTPAIFDGRNIYQPEEVRAAGFSYHGIGRP